ncbi:MAG: OB-fold domain-containing protein [Microthrixaceae bacterium]|nr:OB-fold domain-containing protein [Microthrixaceae bacterium]
MPGTTSSDRRRGILAAAGYLPHWRLDRSSIAAVLGGNQGRGTRTVASYDEDPLTLGVAAARNALGSAPGAMPSALWFATTSPVYAEKTTAPIAAAALRLGADLLAGDAGPGLRGASAALRSALRSGDESVLVVAGDVRTGMSGSPEERDGGDAGAALLVGDESAGTLVAEHLGSASVTEEFLDRWKAPGELRMHAWEERFGQQRYADLAGRAWEAACKDAGVQPEQVTSVAITGPHARAGAKLAKGLSAAGVDVVDTLGSTVGFSGAAHGPLMLAHLVETASAGDVVALVSMADGADVFLFRVTGEGTPASAPVGSQLTAGDDSLSYAKYLQWRGVLPTQPPNRPEPARMSASAAARRSDWKYGFVGSRDRSSEAVHLPPARVSFVGGTVDDMEPVAMASTTARVVTFTVDSLAYSPSPPTVFAVCDFDGGGRLPIELTDVEPDDVSIGMPVEMTFRRIGTADGIANYFWKARPAVGGTS